MIGYVPSVGISELSGCYSDYKEIKCVIYLVITEVKQIIDLKLQTVIQALL